MARAQELKTWLWRSSNPAQPRPDPPMQRVAILVGSGRTGGGAPQDFRPGWLSSDADDEQGGRYRAGREGAHQFKLEIPTRKAALKIVACPRTTERDKPPSAKAPGAFVCPEPVTHKTNRRQDRPSTRLQRLGQSYNMESKG